MTLTVMGPPSPEIVADWIREGMQREVEAGAHHGARWSQSIGRRAGDQRWGLPHLSASLQLCEACMDGRNRTSRRHGQQPFALDTQSWGRYPNLSLSSELCVNCADAWAIAEYPSQWGRRPAHRSQGSAGGSSSRSDQWGTRVNDAMVRALAARVIRAAATHPWPKQTDRLSA